MMDIGLHPSKASRRVACPGSRELELRYPNTLKSQSAREGEAAHRIASDLVLRKIAIEDLEEQIGTTSFNGELITKEMIDGAKLFFDTINHICVNSILDHKLFIEEPIAIPTIHTSCRGRPDCFFFMHSSLWIVEYKFGHRPVEAFENWQLIEYAIGIIDTFTLQNLANSVNFVVVQPRCFDGSNGVKYWRAAICEFLEYKDKLIAAEHKSLEPNAPCNPNPECTFCSARHVCPALQASALTAIDLAKHNFPHVLKPETVGNELRLLEHTKKYLEARITGLTEQALGYIKDGHRVSGYRAEPGAGSEKWNQPYEEVMQLGRLFDVDLSRPREPITPNQARHKGVPDEVVKAKSYRSKGALKLVPNDDFKTKNIFKNLNKE